MLDGYAELEIDKEGELDDEKTILRVSWEIKSLPLMTSSIHDREALLSKKERKTKNKMVSFLSEVKKLAEKNEALVDYIILMWDTANWKSKWYYICWQLIGKDYELLKFIVNHSMQNWYSWWIDVYGENEPILWSLLKESLKRRDLKAFGLIFDMERKGQKWFSIWIKDFADEENLEIKTNRKWVRDILKLALKKWLPVKEEDIMFAAEWRWCSFTICRMLLESPQATALLNLDLIIRIKQTRRVNTEHGRKIREILSWLDTNWTVLMAKKQEQWICRVARPELDKEGFRRRLNKKYWVGAERMGDVKALLRTLIMNNDERHELLALIIIHSVQNWCEWWIDLIRYKKKPEKTLIELAIVSWNFIAFRLLSSLWLFDKIESVTKILDIAMNSKVWSEISRKAIYKQLLSLLKWKYTVDKKMITMIIESWNEVFFKILLENSPDIFDKQWLYNLLANTKLIPKKSWARTIIGERLQQLDKAE